MSALGNSKSPEKKTVICAACLRRRENIKQAAIKVWRKVKGKRK